MIKSILHRPKIGLENRPRIACQSLLYRISPRAINSGSVERRNSNRYPRGITAMKRKPLPPSRKCPICGVDFVPGAYRLWQVYCSRKCVKQMHSNVTAKEIAQYKKRVDVT